jgi:hypothetical protein
LRVRQAGQPAELIVGVIAADDERRAAEVFEAVDDMEAAIVAIA